MINVSVRHTVADYDQWRAVFDADQAKLSASGATAAAGARQVFRDQTNPNDVTVMTEWDSVENAEKFMQSPWLAEAMKAAGVTSKPDVRYLHRV